MTTASFHFYNGHQNATAVIVVVCSAISLYNALELLLLILTTFHVYRGLYFSSLVAASAGIILYVLGFLFEYFKLAPEAVGIAVDTLGWTLMVTGQSVVLYSRLGIVMGEGHRRGRVLRAVKWMIILDALIFHTMTTVVVFGAHFSTSPFYTAYTAIEKIQMTAFTLQEFILSGLISTTCCRSCARGGGPSSSRRLPRTRTPGPRSARRSASCTSCLVSM
ncbi:hypothetical protein BU16DRAFT_528962 [Lophium mytilinum]|uniref:DUF7703 domain-containing protein n=1 Tax=Lophium mytilinum TaxID=390894 RepID=A0A6A6QKT1_9PEZI|nr:hypothetical protein BU16DRAFT_528962 [Lophium mytilinum]